VRDAHQVGDPQFVKGDEVGRTGFGEALLDSVAAVGMQLVGPPSASSRGSPAVGASQTPCVR
jgi:hypothetical protein